MLDHISVRVRDLHRAVEFYKQALSALGYGVIMEFPGVVGMGAGGKPDFWVTRANGQVNPVHIAFSADRACVDAFHAAALAAGATDNGPPGLRTDYHPNYYGAFVLDPDGNNIEVVCHEAPRPAASGAAPRARRPAAKAPARKAAPRSSTRSPKAKTASNRTSSTSKKKRR